MKLKDFEDLNPKDRVLLNNGRIAQIISINSSPYLNGKYYARMFYIDTHRKITKSPRQIARKVNL